MDSRDLTGVGWSVMFGSCLDRLPELADNSVDAVVCDPPYELGFMGKSWDSSGIAFNSAVWAECLRVLKPGGHLLAFGGSRTWHRIAVAVEDAGFEIRDSIAWLYGSGFPKSLDVSKAIDKGTGENRARQLRFTEWMRSTGVTVQEVNEATGTQMGSHYLSSASQPAIATADLFDKLRHLLPEVPEEIERLVAERTGIEWTAYKQRLILDSKWRTPSNKPEFATKWGFGAKSGGDYDITAPSTPEAQKWQGWGTALKPAFEPVIVGRKPLVGTVAANVLLWGTGGLNIDGTRITTTDNLNGGAYAENGNREVSNSLTTGSGMNMPGATVGKPFQQPAGRWPSNVMLDEVTAGMVDEQSGVSKDGIAVNKNRTGKKPNEVYQGGWGNTSEDVGFRGFGGASRFFYVAKASKRDRNEGLDALDDVTAGERVDRVEGSAGMDSPRAGAGRTASAKNFHPTVKPTDLMRQLVRLVTPPGGIVLDPFTGSGSTGKAAILEGFQFIGCELTEDYLPIIQGRIDWAVAEVARLSDLEEEKLF